ncbi:hypothetical protein MTO96_001945 [Rhipicephalus appendiculatus]
MEGIAGDQSSAAPDDDLLAFVRRATETVRAALDRPVKTKAKINLKRYVQRQLLKSYDASRYRGKKKQNRTSTSPMTVKVMPTQCYGNSEHAQYDNSYASPTGDALQYGDTSFNVSATYSASRMDASGYGTSVGDEFLCGQLSFCSEVAPEDAAPFATVDPVFPSENCDQIVPFIANELQRYVCAEPDAPKPDTGGDVSGSVSSSPCMYEPRDCAYASFVEDVSSIVLSSNDSSRDHTCSFTSPFLPLY